MRKTLLPLVLLALLMHVVGCGGTKQTKQSSQASASQNQAAQNEQSTTLTETEVKKGTSELLVAGVRTVIGDLENNYTYFYENERLRIPFPPEAKDVKEQVLEQGRKEAVTGFVRDLNVAAALALMEARDVWVSRIENVAFDNPRALVRAGGTTITDSLRAATRADLIEQMIPIIKEGRSTDVAERLESGKPIRTGRQLIENWKTLIKIYNGLTMLTGGEQIDMDDVNLYRYVAEQAVDRLFLLVADYEKQLRANPDTEDSELIRRLLQTAQS